MCHLFYPSAPLLPVPCVEQGLLNGNLGFPTELGVGESGVRPNLDDVAGAASYNLIWQVDACGLLEGVDKFEDAQPLARANVEILVVGLVLTL